MTPISPLGGRLRLAHGRHLDLGARATIMGILNVTPDSFSDGGRHATVDSAVEAALAMVAGRSVGLVTAPGGRGVIAQALGDAGATLRRANVYARVPTPPTPARIARLLALPAPWLLPLSSAEALARTLAALPPAALARLHEAQVLAASDRLAALAHASGFAHVARAADARPASLLAAAQPSCGLAGPAGT